MSIAALLTGIVQSLGTSWGLFRHYWVLAKVLITAVATVLLLAHMRGISFVAAVALARGSQHAGADSGSSGWVKSGARGTSRCAPASARHACSSCGRRAMRS